MKKVLAAILAALTSPEVVTAEKNLAVLALTRFVILVPSAGLVVTFIVKGLS